MNKVSIILIFWKYLLNQKTSLIAERLSERLMTADYALTMRIYIIGRAGASPPSAVNECPLRIYMYIYLYPSDHLASGWPRATRKRKDSRLAHAHMVG